jgi:molybdopterin/thiamine biosynthesis adenylyltransferase
MIIRMHSEHSTSLLTHLSQRRDVETAAILFAEALPAESGHLLVVRQVLPWPEDGYTHRSIDRLQLDPILLTHALKPARDRGWSVITVHSHPGCDDAWFSRADDAGDSRLMPALQCQIPDVPHGSVVITGTGQVAARLFSPTGESQPAEMVVVGKTVKMFTPLTISDGSDRDHRQRLALGPYGMACLHRATIGIVGLGGIGSEVAKTLAHLGVGTLVLIDGDIVEESNLPRIVGATPDDVVARTPKVRIAERYASLIKSRSRIRTIDRHLQHALPSLRGSDLVISCVDKHTPRAVLNRLSYQELMPVIDTGVAFRVDEMGRLTGDAGRVVVVGPGRPCLACWGHLNPDALREENLSADERRALADDGYIRGANVRQPAVMSFNAVIANWAVIEVLRLIAGFSDDLDVERMMFSFSTATVKQNALPDDRTCNICRSQRMVPPAPSAP